MVDFETFKYLEDGAPPQRVTYNWNKMRDHKFGTLYSDGGPPPKENGKVGRNRIIDLLKPL